MDRSELISMINNYEFSLTSKDIAHLAFEHLLLHADHLALKKYVARQFLGLNGSDELIKIDEEKKKLLDEEHEVIKNYSDEIFQDLFADFVARFGSPTK